LLYKKKLVSYLIKLFFFVSRRRHTISKRDWSSDVCSSDLPKAMGFEFSLEPFSDDAYQYQLYVTEPIKHLNIELYDPDTIIYKGSLLSTNEVEVGMNEGQIDTKDVPYTGKFRALITVLLEDGTYENYETELYID